MKFKIGYTEQSKGWTGSVIVEGEEEEEVKTKALEIAKEVQTNSQRLTLNKLRGM